MFGFKKKQSDTPEEQAVASSVQTAPVVTASAGISAEIVAVISAAIAAMESNASVSANGLIIRKISRISGNSTAWSMAGLNECIDSRRV